MTAIVAPQQAGLADTATPIIATRRLQLDGLRACAVLGVMSHHYVIESFLGQAGVWLFFVLSGFLITGILLDLRDNSAMPVARRIGSFYIHRGLRLFPAYLLVVLGAAAIGLGTARQDLPWHLLYLSNWLMALRDAWPIGLAHLWTLGVEEQFYLLWPLVICFVPRRWLVPVIGAVAVSAMLFRTAAYQLYSDSLIVWIATPSVADALALGGLLVIWMRSRPAAPPAGGRLIVAGLVLAVLAYLLVPDAWYAAFGTTLWIAPMAMLVHGGYAGFSGWLGAFLENPLLVYLGRISYGIYLYHLPVWDLLVPLGEALPGPGLARWVILVAVAAAVTLGLAALSWAFVERPLYRLRHRFPYR